MKVYQYFLLLLAVPMACQSMEDRAVGRKILPPIGGGAITVHTGEVLPRLMREIQQFQDDPQAMHDHLEGRLKGLGLTMPEGVSVADRNEKAFTKLAGKLREQSRAADPNKGQRVIRYGRVVEVPRRVDPVEGGLVVGQGRKPVRPIEQRQVIDPLKMQVTSQLIQEAKPFHGDAEKMKNFLTTELGKHGVTMERYNFDNALSALVDARVKEYSRDKKG